MVEGDTIKAAVQAEIKKEEEETPPFLEEVVAYPPRERQKQEKFP